MFVACFECNAARSIVGREVKLRRTSQLIRRVNVGAPPCIVKPKWERWVKTVELDFIWEEQFPRRRSPWARRDSVRR